MGKRMNKERKTILIVDDEQENIDIVQRKLLRKAYDCIGEVNSERAIETVHRVRPDLIVMDWQMPGLSGIELLEKYRADELAALIPVIIMTGVMKESEHLQRAFEIGATDFLRKPIDSIELNSRISSILELRDEQQNRLELEQKLFLLQQQELRNEIERKQKELSDLSFRFVNNNRTAEKFITTMDKIIDGTGGNFNRSEIDKQITDFKKELFTLHWGTIEQKFLDSRAGFKSVLRERYPDLNEHDLKLSLLYSMKLSNKEISDMTFVSYEAVRKARTRLRKKLGLDSHLDLAEFLSSIG
jgi:CheY-like chemotaxis protein